MASNNRNRCKVNLFKKEQSIVNNMANQQSQLTIIETIETIDNRLRFYYYKKWAAMFIVSLYLIILMITFKNVDKIVQRFSDEVVNISRHYDLESHRIEEEIIIRQDVKIGFLILLVILIMIQMIAFLTVIMAWRRAAFIYIVLQLITSCLWWTLAFVAKSFWFIINCTWSTMALFVICIFLHDLRVYKIWQDKYHQTPNEQIEEQIQCESSVNDRVQQSNQSDSKK